MYIIWGCDDLVVTIWLLRYPFGCDDLVVTHIISIYNNCYIMMTSTISFFYRDILISATSLVTCSYQGAYQTGSPWPHILAVDLIIIQVNHNMSGPDQLN